MTAMILGQSAPAATTATNLYTVPSGKSTVCSTLAITNRNASASATYRVAVCPAGATLANQHYIAYNASLPKESSDYLTIGITLAATDVVTIYASTADFSFTLFGDES